MHIPYFRILFYTIISFISMLFIVINYNNGLEISITNGNYLIFFGEFLKIFFIYGLIYSPILFCWWNWGPIQDGGYIYKILSPIFSLLIMEWSFFPFIKFSNNINQEKLKKSKNLIYKNELINLSFLLFISIFPDLITWINNVYFLEYILICLYFLFFYLYYQKQKSLNKLEYFLLIIIMILIHLESYTENISFLFFHHFHLIALFIYLLSIFLIFFWLLQTKILNIILPINLILYFLFKNNIFRRLCLLFINIQYFIYLSPLLKNLGKILLFYYSKKVIIPI